MGNIWSQRKLRLLPEGADQWGAPLTAPELTPRLSAPVRNVLRTEVRQGMALEMTPDVFGGVEFGRVSRQPSQGDLAARALHIVAHLATAAALFATLVVVAVLAHRLPESEAYRPEDAGVSGRPRVQRVMENLQVYRSRLTKGPSKLALDDDLRRAAVN